MPTPTCSPEAPNHGSNSNGPHNLVEVAASGWVPGMMWRTPSANVIEAKSTVVKLTGRKPSDPQVGLADQVMAAHRMQWPTPTATAYKGWSPNHNRAATDDRLDYAIEREAFTSVQDAPPMRLSPDWVELLMGWPKGWTSLRPLGSETGKATPRESPAELPTEATA